MSNTIEMLRASDSGSNVVHGSFREGIMARIVRQIRDWNNRRQAIRQLNMMPDSLLKDIGIEVVVVQVEKEAFARHLEGIGTKLNAFNANDYFSSKNLLGI